MRSDWEFEWLEHMAKSFTESSDRVWLRAIRKPSEFYIISNRRRKIRHRNIYNGKMNAHTRRTRANHEVIKKACLRAAQIVCRAVKKGELPDLKRTFVLCVDCKEKRATIYEHRDYSKPLNVEPTCHRCNLLRGPAIISKSVPTRRKASNAHMDAKQFLDKLRHEVKRCGSQKKAAEELGISQQFLCDVLKGRRGPGEKLLAALDLEKRETYVRVK